MQLLVLGGTQFVGRHLVEAALAAGHRVSLFTRGKTNPGLFPEAEHLVGDRQTGDYAALAGRTWDAVVDTCGYVPRVVGQAAELLAPHCGHYTFISSISVYADHATPGQDERAPTVVLDDPTTEDVMGNEGRNYGGLKVLCERAVRAALPGRTLVVRPGIVVGPYDPSDRFSYWPWRLARGGQVLAPGDPDGPVQYVDARDLARWLLAAIARSVTGVFNAVHEPLTMREFLERGMRAVAPAGELVWVAEAFLLEHGVTPYAEIPLWLPSESAGFARMDASRARSEGLASRPVEDTFLDTLAWLRTLPDWQPRKAGLAPEREAELLAAYRQPAP